MLDGLVDEKNAREVLAQVALDVPALGAAHARPRPPRASDHDG